MTPVFKLLVAALFAAAFLGVIYVIHSRMENAPRIIAPKRLIEALKSAFHGRTAMSVDLFLKKGEGISRQRLSLETGIPEECLILVPGKGFDGDEEFVYAIGSMRAQVIIECEGDCIEGYPYCTLRFGG